MKTVTQFISLGMLLVGSACHDLERSRSVDNPAVAGGDYRLASLFELPWRDRHISVAHLSQAGGAPARVPYRSTDGFQDS